MEHKPLPERTVASGAYVVCHALVGRTWPPVTIMRVARVVFHSKCINPIVVLSFSLVTNSIDNCDKKTFYSSSENFENLRTL